MKTAYAAERRWQDRRVWASNSKCLCNIVMAVLVTAIHAVPLHRFRDWKRNGAAWVAGMKPAMT